MRASVGVGLTLAGGAALYATWPRLAPRLSEWLAHPIWPTLNERLAERLPFQYARNTPNDVWTTSPLGVINGVLPRVGVVVVRHYDDHSGRPVPPYLSVRKRWW